MSQKQVSRWYNSTQPKADEDHGTSSPVSGFGVFRIEDYVCRAYVLLEDEDHNTKTIMILPKPAMVMAAR